jgi:TetR/AcrR family transcriptional repressor of nem operon
MATLVGALVLSRATQGTPLSNEVLAAARGYLLARVSKE